MTFQILGKTQDQRSGANVIYCKCTVGEYLDIIGNDFENFSIQRKKENHKAYKRLKEDLKEGALLPSITLAVKHHKVSEVLAQLNNDQALAVMLSRQGYVDILDGLQRTYIINELKDSGCEFKPGQELLLEYWIEPDLGKLIYRMIVLNAGQKSMSMRHQIELLFMSLQATITEKIDGLQILLERDEQNNKEASKYPLSIIAAAYHAFMTKSTELKANVVAEQLGRDSILDSSEITLTSKFEGFINYLKKIHEINKLAWAYYQSAYQQDRIDALEQLDSRSAEEEIELKKLSIFKNGNIWLASENVFVALFCALATYTDTPKEDRLNSALRQLKDRFVNKEEDPLGLVKYERIRTTINPRKTNIGFATRKILLNGFKEFFRDDGDTPIGTCWEQAVD